MKRTSFLVMAIGLLSVLSAHAPVATAKPSDHKVVICHVPPGNPENAHTLTVGAPAVEAHLDHGDYLGECRDRERESGRDRDRERRH